MGRGLMIDAIARRPDEEEGGFESADPADMSEPPEAPRSDPEALIAGIESQLAELRALVAGL